MGSGSEEGEINAYLGAKSDRKRCSTERYHENHKKGKIEDPFAEYERLSRRYSPERNRSRSPSYTRHSRERERRHHYHSPPPKKAKDDKRRQEPHRHDGYRRDDKRRDNRSREERHRNDYSTDYRRREESSLDKKLHQTKDKNDEKETKEEPLPEIEIKDEDEKQKEEDRLIEERRLRRLAILNKYKEVPSTPSFAAYPESSDASPLYKLEKENANDNVVEHNNVDQNSDSPNDVSAADYDPSMDRIKDLAHTSTNHKNILTHTSSQTDLLKTKDHQEKVSEGVDSQADMLASEYTEKLEKPSVMNQMTEIDMFSDNLDMFATATDIKTGHNALLSNMVAATNPSLTDNWDDAEGYYSTRIGETLDGRYVVLANLGRGVFSSVVRAKDQDTDEEVAIKLIRNNETMYKAGQKELTFLKKLMEADPDNRKHVIRLKRHFEHRNHLCLVFETLSMNLRDILKKYGKNIGISIKAVRAYAQQLFLSLSLLQKCNILHADIKPDNILVSESRNTLKLCDLGSASDASDNAITPYLVSRFYRAPEIMLGLNYDYGIDVWSVGCTLYELFTGKILFPGRNNNQMLRHIMELKGRFPNKLLRKAQFTSQHFDSDYVFLSYEIDKVSKNEIVKKITFIKPVRDVKSRIMAACTSNSDEESRLIQAFIDLLDKCLILGPDKRLTPKEALMHPFITGKV
ncbi:kinase-like domain-containing protein [Sporodiniella umbellata]|nr:kinase-like domain-containing protein [Sporodiniella umbellata]